MLARDKGKVRRHQGNDFLRKEHAQDGDPAHQNGKRCYNIIGEFPGGAAPLFVAVIGKDGYKGGAQSALRKQVPQQVGNSEGNNKGIVGVARSEEPGKHLFAHKTEKPAYEYGKTDGTG